MSTEADIVERMTAQAADGVDFHGETMNQWDNIRQLCAKHDGSDLPRLMFEGLIESFADLLTEGAAEITKLRAERDTAARDMRERCAKVAEEKYAKPAWHDFMRSSGQNIAAEIRALPDTPAVIATEGTDG